MPLSHVVAITLSKHIKSHERGERMMNIRAMGKYIFANFFHKLYVRSSENNRNKNTKLSVADPTTSGCPIVIRGCTQLNRAS